LFLRGILFWLHNNASTMYFCLWHYVLVQNWFIIPEGSPIRILHHFSKFSGGEPPDPPLSRLWPWRKTVVESLDCLSMPAFTQSRLSSWRRWPYILMIVAMVKLVRVWRTALPAVWHHPVMRLLPSPVNVYHSGPPSPWSADLASSYSRSMSAFTQSRLSSRRW